MFSVAAVGLALLLSPALRGEDKVLFIGNSFTIGSGGGGVPGIFDRLAQAGGHGDPTTVTLEDLLPRSFGPEALPDRD